MMESFVAGENRTRQFVGELVGEFAACGLDDDDRFTDLQYALAMFGNPDYLSVDEKYLAAEFQRALTIIGRNRDT
jgi:hypothetical protein